MYNPQGCILHLKLGFSLEIWLQVMFLVRIYFALSLLPFVALE
jgi:hypothetical protein